MEPLLHADDSWVRSQLFTVRVWQEQTSSDAQQVRIQVRHVVTGETLYFGEWSRLINYLVSKLVSSS